MSRTDRQIFITALGILAVILHDNMQNAKKELQIMDIADLIEAYCRSALPDAFEQEDHVVAA